jgi:hypothetical protein
LETKRCQRCKQSKRLTTFDLARPGFRRATCRDCRDENQGRATPAPKRFARSLDARRYIITGAQNATPIVPEFFAALKAAAAHLGAELVVIPLRYKNPTSVWSNRQVSDEWWAPELAPYLHNVRKKLHPHLVLAGDVKIQPTASSPLTGFESLTGAESCIIGHPKMQFRSVPVPTGRFPKILTTTGVCTRKNYTDSKAGKLGEFHHCLGALVVELQGAKKFHIRQLNADRADGSFIDLDTLYTAEGVRPAPPALGLVMGDTHARFIDPKVDAATFGPGGIVETLNPQTLVFHDVHDGYAANPHHMGNPFIASAKHRGGLEDVRAEVEFTVGFVASRSKGRRSVLVSSNHDNFLSRWVVREDWKRDPRNAPFYLETAAAMLRTARMGPAGAEYADPFAYWVEQMRGKADIRCLGSDESFKLGDIECGLHGHQGPNGSRGTLRNLSRLGARVISGHTHTPGIEEGHYQCGTSTPLRLEYTHGPSSWLNTHCAVYANGRRALLTIIDGDWRLP